LEKDNAGSEGHKEESLLAFAPPFVPFDLRAMSVLFFDRKK
jgi:hypothetical protein